MTDRPLAPPSLSGEDFVRLEVLRGVAALVVVFNHARGWLWAGGGYVRSHGLSADYGPLEWALFALNLLTRCGHEAVIVFFLLSGFSIAHSLRPRPGREAPLMGFYKRRLIRLYPPYLGGLLWASAVALIVMALPGDPALPVRRGAHRLLTLDAEDWFASLAYLPSLPFVPQYWSLIHEVVFYGLAPFLLRRARGYIGVSLLVGVIGIATLGRVVPESIPADFLLRYNLFFALGVLAYRNHATIAGWCAHTPVVCKPWRSGSASSRWSA